MSLLPFSVSGKYWGELNEKERSFFCCDEDVLPLDHVRQIKLIRPPDSEGLFDWAMSSIPNDWPDGVEHYRSEDRLSLSDKWDNESSIQEVQQWLHANGVPKGREVYLLYDRDRIVCTTWEIVVLYWYAFAWSVGFAMISIDHTRQWACCFHHEDTVIFGKR